MWRALAADLLACGRSISEVPTAISWWELWAFYEASGPSSRVCAVELPDLYGWTVEAIVTARAFGVELPFETSSARGAAPRRRADVTGPLDASGVADDWFHPQKLNRG